MNLDDRRESMGQKKESSGNFVVQGSILATASIVARIIGLIYRVPVTRIIGDYGNGLYGFAFEVYSMVLLISSYSLPTAISKLVAARTHKGEHKNAYKIFKAGLFFTLVVGALAGSITFILADYISNTIMKDPMIALSLRVLAPTIFIVAIMGVLRGYFQGLGTMMPTAVSQIVEQIVNAFVSVIAAYYLFAYGSRVANVLQNEDYAPAYGAAGSSMGTLLGAIVGGAFLGFMMLIYKRVLKKKMAKDHTEYSESYRTIYILLFSTIVPIVLSTAVYNSSVFLDGIVFNNVMIKKGVSNPTELFGVFTGKYRLLVNVPVSIASAMAASMIPSLTAAVTARSRRLINQKIGISIRFIMVISIPCTVGLAVLGSPILQLLFGDESQLPANMLMIGSLAVVLYSLSTLSNGILQGLNRMNVPVVNAFISLVVHIIVVYILLTFTKLNIYAVVIGNVIFALLMCMLNSMVIRRITKYSQEIKKTFVIPGIASVVMGIVSYVVYFGIYWLTKNNDISVIIALGMAVAVYGIVLLLLKGFTEEELRSLPKGTLLLKVAKKLHLM